jgi:integrase
MNNIKKGTVATLFNELKSDKAVNKWIIERISDKKVEQGQIAKSSVENYKRGFAYYINHLRTNFDGLENVTGEMLIIEAKDELNSNDMYGFDETLDTYLSKFFDFLVDTYKPKTVNNYMQGVKDFYYANKININSKKYTIQSKYPDEKNVYNLSKDEILKCFESLSLRDKCICLVQVSSGMGRDEVVRLTVSNFKDGYDKKDNVCFIAESPRPKTNVKRHTWLSSECCDYINEYIEWRNHTPIAEKGTKDYNDYLKRKIYSDDDILFTKQLDSNDFLNYINESEDGYSQKYFDNNRKKVTIDSHFRQLKEGSLSKAYRNAEKNACLSNKHNELGEIKYYGIFRANNLRGLFSTSLLDSPCEHIWKEYWIGHTVGTSEFYDDRKYDVSKAEYLKSMSFLAITSKYELKKYKNRELDLTTRYEDMQRQNEELQKQNEDGINQLRRENQIERQIDTLNLKMEMELQPYDIENKNSLRENKHFEDEYVELVESLSEDVPSDTTKKLIDEGQFRLRFKIEDNNRSIIINNEKMAEIKVKYDKSIGDLQEQLKEFDEST